jgi:hypothetical protein
MITKVGRTTPMLICTDCGQPVDQRECAVLKRKRLWGAITLMGMACIGGSMFLLSFVNEIRTAGRLELQSEGRGEAHREERSGSASGSGAFFHPGGVVQYR